MNRKLEPTSILGISIACALGLLFYFFAPRDPLWHVEQRLIGEWQFKFDSSPESHRLTKTLRINRLRLRDKSGEYIGIIKKNEFLNGAPTDTTLEDIAILLPPIGGLKSITVNQKPIHLADEDYSSIGPIVPLSVLNDTRSTPDTVEIRIRIQDNGLRSYMGAWIGFPSIGPIQIVLKKRDGWLIHQKTIPIISAVFLYVLGAIFLLLYFRLNPRVVIFREFSLALITNATFNIFLSGLIRDLYPLIGAVFHMPFRTLFHLFFARLFAYYRGLDKKQINALTALAVITLIAQVTYGLFNQKDVLPYSVPIADLIWGFALFFPAKKDHSNTSKTPLGLYLFAVVLWTASLMDALKYQAFTVEELLPYIYLTRYVSTPFFFIAVYYLVNRFVSERELLSAAQSMKEISLRVRHDIKSPLAVMQVAIENFHELEPENRSLLKHAYQRISQLSNSLADANGALEEPSLCDLNAIIEDLVRQKKFEHLATKSSDLLINFLTEHQSVVIPVQKSELIRSLSNLVNNAIEASTANDPVRIDIELDWKDGFCEVSIQDFGKGMDQKLIRQLGKRKITLGKQGGSGYGFRHFVEFVERHRGRWKVASDISKGTIVYFYLPTKK